LRRSRPCLLLAQAEDLALRVTVRRHQPARDGAFEQRPCTGAVSEEGARPKKSVRASAWAPSEWPFAYDAGRTARLPLRGIRSRKPTVLPLLRRPMPAYASQLQGLSYVLYSGGILLIGIHRRI
jgi:hypothetical protein